MTKKIIKNAVECVGCGKIVESTHVHDYREHSCSTGRRPIWFMVDGGTFYLRRGWQAGTTPEMNYIERSEYES